MSEVGEGLAALKAAIRDLGDMACIGCRHNTCPACGLAAEITSQAHILAARVESDHLPHTEAQITEERDRARPADKDGLRTAIEALANLAAEHLNCTGCPTPWWLTQWLADERVSRAVLRGER